MKPDRYTPRDMHQPDGKGGVTNGKLMADMLGDEPSTLEITIKQLEAEGYPQNVINQFKKGRR